MKRFNFPNIDDKAVFHKLALAKRKKRGCKQCENFETEECDRCNNNNRAVMIKMEPYIFSRYDDYDNYLDCLGDIEYNSLLPKSHADLLENTFNSSEFDNVRRLIIDNLPDTLKGICPFCMIGEPATLEHYLPKKKFPEFTLYSKNLIPCCHVCNTYKGVKYINEKGTRRFINYYIDDVENKAFLKSVIRVDDGIPTVDFIIDLCQDDVLYETISSHFECLHLYERYICRSNSVISSLIDTIVKTYAATDNIDNIINESIPLLQLQLNALTKQYGKNYWKASIFRGIIDSKEIFKELIKNYYMHFSC